MLVARVRQTDVPIYSINIYNEKMTISLRVFMNILIWECANFFWCVDHEVLVARVRQNDVPIYSINISNEKKNDNQSTCVYEYIDLGVC